MVEKKTDYKLQGKKNRKSGADFERRVRADLNSKGWIVDKWGNNVEFGANIVKEGSCMPPIIIKPHLIQAKAKWSGPNRPMMMGAGFPDFIAFTKIWEREDKVLGDKLVHCGSQVNQTIIGVECKVGKSLGKIEKEKCQWLLDNNIFSKILIAYKEKEGRKIVVKYKEFTK